MPRLDQTHISKLKIEMHSTILFKGSRVEIMSNFRSDPSIHIISIQKEISQRREDIILSKKPSGTWVSKNTPKIK